VDYIDLFDRASAWTADKVQGANGKLDAETPCEAWKVRDLLNHVLDTQRYFAGVVDDQKTPLPSPTPPDVLGTDPVKQYEEARETVLRAYRRPGAIEKTGPSLGIAFADQLIHGWDLASATGQDTTMPDDLAQAAFDTINGRMPDDKRGGNFKPSLPVSEGASAQERLLAYSGRLG
jgi:uncharacterized protein (TIGR03086 family)